MAPFARRDIASTADEGHPAEDAEDQVRGTRDRSVAERRCRFVRHIQAPQEVAQPIVQVRRRGPTGRLKSTYGQSPSSWDQLSKVDRGPFHQGAG